jgi:hypothetical protein
VHPHHFVSRHGKHPEWKTLPQIVLRGKRQTAKVIKAPHRIPGNPRLGKPLPVKRCPLSPLDLPSQRLNLQGLQFRSRHCLNILMIVLKLHKNSMT